MIEYHVHIRSTDHFKEVRVREKNDRNEINSGGSPCLTMNLRNHLLITSGNLFWYCFSRSRSNLPGWLCPAHTDRFFVASSSEKKSYRVSAHKPIFTPIFCLREKIGPCALGIMHGCIITITFMRGMMTKHTWSGWPIVITWIHLKMPGTC